MILNICSKCFLAHRICIFYIYIPEWSSSLLYYFIFLKWKKNLCDCAFPVNMGFRENWTEVQVTSHPPLCIMMQTLLRWRQEGTSFNLGCPGRRAVLTEVLRYAKGVRLSTSPTLFHLLSTIVFFLNRHFVLFIFKIYF